MNILAFSQPDLKAIIRLLEDDALALVATFPAEAVRLAWIAALIRAEVIQ
jgi:hypothetical protein